MATRDALYDGGHRESGAGLPGTKPGTDHDVDHHEDHPGERFYVNVALILTTVTAIEVVIYYVHALKGILVPALIILSVFKFIAVVGYFMHLKMDDLRFRWLFLAGLIITVSVILALMAMLWTHGYYTGIDKPA